MPKPIRTGRRTWVAAWAALCVAGLAATAGLRATSAPDPRRERPVSAECREYTAHIEKLLREKAEQEGGDGGILAFPRDRFVGVAHDCGDEIRDHFRGDR
ncbi:hypothetical protein ABZ154_16350 [Streptomyces sp. NPDC006261]|uniref:hypothetical protein n=1 Tax=Streptomyces sp. NPDC006261 TaxID=3156739 RepID=UPI0033A00CFF